MEGIDIIMHTHVNQSFPIESGFYNFAQWTKLVDLKGNEVNCFNKSFPDTSFPPF